MASDLRPALAASAALHILVVGAGLLVFPQAARHMRSTAVPVTIVTRAPSPDLRPAIEAPETMTASTPEPAPVPEPEPPPPPPPAPAPPSPAPPKPQPKLDLNALASKMPQTKAQPRQQPLDLSSLAARMPRRNAPRGADQAETAPEARPALGAAQGLTADEASLLAAKLNRLWRPNCVAEGAANVQVRVNIQLLPNGALAAEPRIVGNQQADAVWRTAAQRALSAVKQGVPYTELPRARYAQWRDINFNFNARQACLGI